MVPSDLLYLFRLRNGLRRTSGRRLAVPHLRVEALEARTLLTFAPPVNYPIGPGQEDVVVGDFNNDGRLDLATTGPSGVSMLLGNGNGTFRSANGNPTGGRAAAAADFNRDGRLDLAVVGNSDLSVLPGSGNGSFGQPTNYTTGSETVAVVADDFNGDSRPDIALASRGSHTVSVFLGNGNGTFQPRRDYQPGVRPQFLAVGDFNRDGRRDLVVANGDDGNVRVMTGLGDGTFQLAGAYASGGAFPHSVAVADYDGDGRSDLAVVNAHSNNLNILLGNGDGSFRSGATYSTGAWPIFIASGDLDGDGNRDLAVVNRDANRVSVRLGNGDGSFRIAVDYAVGDGPGSVAVADFNGDRAPDLAVPNRLSSNISVLLSQFGVPRRLSVSAPGRAVAGDPISVTVTVLNQFNGPAQNYRGTISFTSNDAGAILPAPYTYTPADNGTHTFSGLALVTAGLQFITAGDDTLADSAAVAVRPGPLAWFYVNPDSGPVVVGQRFDLFVFALDQFSNLITNYAGEVALLSTDEAAVLPQPFTFRPEDGGVAYLPAAVTFLTPGLQELYVFDTATYTAWGYAAYDVVGGGSPGGSASGGGWLPFPAVMPILPARAEPAAPACLPSDAIPSLALDRPSVERLFTAAEARTAGLWGSALAEEWMDAAPLATKHL